MIGEKKTALKKLLVKCPIRDNNKMIMICLDFTMKSLITGTKALKTFHKKLIWNAIDTIYLDLVLHVALQRPQVLAGRFQCNDNF